MVVVDMEDKKGNVLSNILWILCFVVLAAFCAWLINKGASAFCGVDYMSNSNVDTVAVFWDSVLNHTFEFDEKYKLLSIVTFICILLLGVYYSDGRSKRERRRLNKGEEYGSARWATDKEIKEFSADEFEDNFLLSRNAAISIPAIKRNEGLKKIFVGRGVSDRNKHILIAGGSGSGKTFNEVGPNLLQSNCSFVSTDPKGDTVKKYGQWLVDNDYNVKVVNIKDTESFQYSFKYNPFVYITDQASIMKLVAIIIENTEGSDDPQAKEDFWIKSERLLYQCLIGYLYYNYESKPQFQNLPTMLDYIGTASASEQDEKEESVLDSIMEEFRDDLIYLYDSEENAKLEPEWYVIKMYEGFKKAAGETAKSIIISCFVRLAPFAIGAVRNMFMDDELELEKIGEEKTALFMIMSDTDKTFNFILSMIFYQLFDINVKKADASEGSHCKIPIMCILDEMANIGRIPDLEIKIATLRSRWINLVPILQSLSQLDAVYGEKKSSIIKSNCDTFVYLGRGDYKTCEEISRMLGKETIEVKSKSKQKNGSSVSTQYIARDLLSPDELYANPERFADDECLVMIKMARPYKDKKFMLFDHPNYEKFSQCAELDIESFVKERRADIVKQQELDEVNKWREENLFVKEKALSEEDAKEIKKQKTAESLKKKEIEKQLDEDFKMICDMFLDVNSGAENKNIYCFV